MDNQKNDDNIYSLEELIIMIRENKDKIKETLKFYIDKPLEDFKLLKPRQIIETMVGEKNIYELKTSNNVRRLLSYNYIQTIGQLIETNHIMPSHRLNETTISAINSIKNDILSEIEDIQQMQNEFITKLADKYRLNTEKIKYILNKYATMQTFLNANRDGKLDDEDKKVFKDNLKTYFDISNNKHQGYHRLGEDYYGNSNNYLAKDNFLIVNISLVKEVLSLFDPVKNEIIKAKLGFSTNIPLSYEQISKEYGLSYSEITKIMYDFTKLVRGAFSNKKFKLGNIESNGQLETIVNKLFNSNAIFYPDEGYKDIPDNFDYKEFSQFLLTSQIESDKEKEKAIKERIETGIAEGKQKKEIAIDVLKILEEDILEYSPIKKLNIPRRASSSLVRARIHTGVDILTTDRKIPGISNTSMEEIQKQITEEFSNIENIPEIISQYSNKEIIEGYLFTDEKKVKRQKDLSPIEKAKIKRDKALERVKKLEKELEEAKAKLAQLDKDIQDPNLKDEQV